MTPATIGVVLAGGQARRMGGGDKALLTVGGETVLARILRVITPQLSAIVLNANGDAGRFAAYGLPVVPDDVPDQPGPLAGVLAGMEWAARHHPAATWIASLPGDAPFLPADLVSRLHAGRGTAQIACAARDGRTHNVVALWSVALRQDLRQALGGGLRKVGDYQRRQGAVAVDWEADGPDPFTNLNHPDDLAEANRLALKS